MIKFIYLCCVSCLIIVCCGFGCGDNPQQSRFSVASNDYFVPVGNPLAPLSKPVPHPFAAVSGNMQAGSQGPGAIGSLAGYAGDTGIFASYTANNVIVPSTWNHTIYWQSDYLSEPCPAVLVPPNITVLSDGSWFAKDVPMTDGGGIIWQCIKEVDKLPGMVSQFGLQGSLPANLTVYSDHVPLSTTNGFPQLYVYGEDASGNQVFNSVTASSVSPDGTNATFPFPTSSNGLALSPSLYSLVLMNSNPDGSMSDAGPSVLSIGGTQSFVSPFGVGAQVSQTSSYASYTDDGYGDGTCVGGTTYSSSTYTYATPIVTQYSQGNVSIGGSFTIAVGPNPTAIQLYNPIDISLYYQSGPCGYEGSDTTQMGNAVVANSGANTISILDLQRNIVTATITVGQNPAALALSADQSTVYVANSGDGTLSSVSLTSNIQTAKISLGASPSAVAVAADGTIWAGGQGFLAHVGANMQLLGSYSTGGYNITSLGYSSTSSELVATSIDGNNTYYVQEISDSQTINNAVASVSAQHQISTLSTAMGSSGLRPLFSGVAQNANIPAMMAGGSLAGNEASEGWLSITATPTGFTVTDTVDHIQIMNASTPSAITSISIDPTNYIAYLALPDSNQVIIVPLPQ